MCPLSSSKHRETRGGEGTNITSPGLSCLPRAPAAVFLASLDAPLYSRLFIFQEKRKLQDETESMTDRLQDETESRRKMADKLSHEHHQSLKEKECTQEVGLRLLCTK